MRILSLSFKTAAMLRQDTSESAQPGSQALGGGYIDQYVCWFVAMSQIGGNRRHQYIPDTLVVEVRLHYQHGAVVGGRTIGVRKRHEIDVAASHWMGSGLSAESSAC